MHESDTNESHAAPLGELRTRDEFPSVLPSASQAQQKHHDQSIKTMYILRHKSQAAVSSTGLSNRFDNRFDNRLYRVNGVYNTDQFRQPVVVVDSFSGVQSMLTATMPRDVQLRRTRVVEELTVTDSVPEFCGSLLGGYGDFGFLAKKSRGVNRFGRFLASS